MCYLYIPKHKFLISRATDLFALDKVFIMLLANQQK